MISRVLIRKSLTLALLLAWCVAVSNGHAQPLERLVPLKGNVSGGTVEIQEGTVLRLHNDWASRLREATILDRKSGNPMAIIERIEINQTVNLEFSRRGTYSICYSSGPLKIQTRYCFKIDVVPVTAT